MPFSCSIGAHALQEEGFFIITRRLRTVEAADKIVVLSDGKVAKKEVRQNSLQKKTAF